MRGEAYPLDVMPRWDRTTSLELHVKLLHVFSQPSFQWYAIEKNNNTSEVHTLLHDEHAGMVEQEVAEGVALRIHVRLSTEAGRLEERERLQGFQGSLAFRHGHGRAGNCEEEGS